MGALPFAPAITMRVIIVELTPGLYLGRALLTTYRGEVRLIAYFALRRFVDEDVQS